MLKYIIILNIIWNKIYFKNEINPKKSKYIDYSVSLFGNLLYNKKYVIALLLPPNDNLNGCNSLPSIDKITKGLKYNKIKNLDYAWLIERGDCSYSRKALNIKSSGSLLGLVYLRDDNLSPKLIIPNTLNNNEKLPTIILISKLDGINFINYMNNGKLPILKLNLDSSIKTKIVKIDYSISTYNLESYRLLLNWKNEFKNLGANIDFKPKYRFKNLNYLVNFINLKYLNKYCLLSGFYCVDDIIYKYSIKEYYLEAVYQKCIFKYYEKSNNLYFDYIKYYYENCININNKFNSLRDCREKNLNKTSLKYKKEIELCVNTSFIDKNDYYKHENLILKTDKLVGKFENLYIIPAIFVNDKLIKEDYKNKIIMSEICNSFITIPNYCKTYFKDIKGVINTNNDFFQSIFSNWIYLTIFIIVILFIIIIILIIARFILNRKLKNVLKKDIDDYLDNYLKIENKDKDKDKIGNN